MSDVAISRSRLNSRWTKDYCNAFVKVNKGQVDFSVRPFRKKPDQQNTNLAMVPVEGGDESEACNSVLGQRPYVSAECIVPNRIAPNCIAANLHNHSITMSAVASIISGIVNPIAFAVLRLRASSNFVACSTGMSAGFSPLKILST